MNTDKYIRYSSLALFCCITLLLLNHIIRGLDVNYLLFLWLLTTCLTIAPICELIWPPINYDDFEEHDICSNLFCNNHLSNDMEEIGSTICNTCFDKDVEEYIYNQDESDLLPHKEEMEERYQPNE